MYKMITEKKEKSNKEHSYSRWLRSTIHFSCFLSPQVMWITRCTGITISVII